MFARCKTIFWKKVLSIRAKNKKKRKFKKLQDKASLPKEMTQIQIKTMKILKRKKRKEIQMRKRQLQKFFKISKKKKFCLLKRRKGHKSVTKLELWVESKKYTRT
jgi:hypothetical protein